MTRTALSFFALIALLGAAPPHLTAGGKPWTAREITQLRVTVDRLLHAPALRGAQVGFIAIDTQRGAVLYQRNADQEFMPASNFKLLVGSTALQRLGLNFSYVTTVAADASPSNGVENGNIYLRGGGDALLSAKDLRQAAEAVAAAGIREVTGSVVTDASHFDDQRLGYGWSWDDLPYYYAPVITALELEDGVAHVHIAQPGAVGQVPPVNVTQQSSAYAVDDELRASAPSSINTVGVVRPWNLPQTIELSGSYPLGARSGGSFYVSVPDPQSLAGDVFLKALEGARVTVTNGVKAGKISAHPVVLWSHNSLIMPQLLARFWYPSDNLMGELMLKELGVLDAGEPGTDEHGAALERRFLRGIGVDPATVSIADGSGLSSYDRITPRDLLAILQYDWRAPYRDVVIDALPLAGVRGTLRRSFIGTPAEYHVFAKTGSLNHVRTISGFVQTRTHGVVTFSLLVNQWMGEERPGGAAALAKVRGSLLSAIAQR